MEVRRVYTEKEFLEEIKRCAMREELLT